jgi:regulator of replication initiation timing
MNTARKRYEAKTKVVTFRVNHELYDELKKLKAKSGLSFADLVKLGAGIAREEIEDKIEEIHGLREKLEQLREAENAGKKTVADMIEKEKQVQHKKLERDLEIFKLFDLGWSIEEVDFKLRLGRREISKYFNEWGELRGEKEKLQEELLKKCLHNYILSLKENIQYRLVGRATEEAKRQLEYYRCMLANPSKLTEEEKTLLIADYSYLL